jgi:hypothetical protein
MQKKSVIVSSKSQKLILSALITKKAVIAQNNNQTNYCKHLKLYNELIEFFNRKTKTVTTLQV